MSILVTYAVAIIIEGILSVDLRGRLRANCTRRYVDSTFHLLGFYLPYIYVFGFVLAVLLLGVLYYMLYRTKFGRAVRASLQNRTAADLIGVNVNRVRTISVGIGVSVTAVGGMVFGATNAFNPEQRLRPDLAPALDRDPRPAWAASAARWSAAMFMLVLDDVVAVAWSPTWAPLVYFASLVVVLSVATTRPVRQIGRARPVSETQAHGPGPDGAASGRRRFALRVVAAAGLLVVAVVFALFPVAVTDPTATSIAVFTLVFMVATVAWNLFSGYSGYLALGHAVFFGCGGYAVALAARDWHFKGGWDVFGLLPFGGPGRRRGCGAGGPRRAAYPPPHVRGSDDRDLLHLPARRRSTCRSPAARPGSSCR